MKTKYLVEFVTVAFRFGSFGFLLVLSAQAQIQYQLLKSFTGVDGRGPLSGVVEASDGGSCEKCNCEQTCSKKI